MSDFTFPRVPTENQRLREQVDFLHAELRRIDVAAAEAAIEQREKIRLEEERKQREEQQHADDVALEEHRLNAHFNQMLDRALAGGNDSFVIFMQRSPDEHKARAPSGWPPGHDPAMYQKIASPPAADTTAKPTALGAMLAQKGVPI